MHGEKIKVIKEKEEQKGNKKKPRIERDSDRVNAVCVGERKSLRAF